MFSSLKYDGPVFDSEVMSDEMWVGILKSIACILHLMRQYFVDHSLWNEIHSRVQQRQQSIRNSI